ncbi:PRC-barrel domain-containing protein [Bacillus sp. BRMEA1]|uniref:PRC-barrel domain-containing protein n=1 Tax=Neobacillus endophyticus TaxID=2738405 RepID=UPI001566B8CC|nr:PRC-barrel domain-containing protein [Neobacillus endophyticus]NRD75942.1 PRC-barrel domain-containing protein [Neobacillus endophyticus]
MRTFSLVKGQPVFETKSGMKMGEVCDLCMSKSGIVTGLLVRTGVFFKQTRYLNIKKVTSFGWDGLMIEDKNYLEKLEESPEYTFTHQNPLEGKLMLSKSGESLGLLKDVYFQEEVGTIIGYEITDGFFSDITEGKQVIHSGKPLTVGKDAIIVEVKET